MNLSEAYKILELSSSATEDEAKKKYRELTKLYHPDVNKEPDAESKFKKINEAYDLIKSKNDPKNSFKTYHEYVEPEHINLNITISFKEAVLGCNKDLKYIRSVKCTDCKGLGSININNGCAICGGKGQIIHKNGNSVFIRNCTKCIGQISTKPCETCNQSGSINFDTIVNVKIPGGVQSNNVLRLGGMGNYVGTNFMFMDQSTDVFLQINVTPEAGLSIKGKDVLSELNISLYDAIKGCKHNINTIDGLKEITINKLSKNKDSIIIPNMGVERRGNQEVILNIDYPDNIEEIIEPLKGSN
jgi:molecular chaperone DnaJ